MTRPAADNPIVLLLFLFPLFFPRNSLAADSAVSSPVAEKNTQSGKKTNPEVSPALDQLRFADGLYRRKMYRMAADEYRKMIQMFPQDPHIPDALFFQGEALRFLGMHKKAAKVYTELCRRYPKEARASQAAVRLGIFALQDGDPKSAASRLKNIPSHQLPPVLNELRHYYLGVALARLKDQKGAQKQYQILAQKNLDPAFPLRAWARLSLVQLLRREKKDKQALKWLDELRNSSSTPAELRAEIYFTSGEIHFYAEEYASAVNAYNQLLRCCADSRYAKQSLLNDSWALLQLKQPQEVINLFNQYGHDVELTSEGQRLLGEALLMLQRDEQARTYFQHVLTFRDTPFRADALFRLIEIAWRLKDYSACVKQAHSFLQEFPRERSAATVAALMGQALIAQKKYPEAARAYESALRDYWGNWPHRKEAEQTLADLYRNLGEYKKAARIYRNQAKSLSSPTEQATALLKAGDCLQLGKDPVGAFADYLAVTTRYPQVPQASTAQMRMAEITIRKKSYAEAVGLLDKLLKKQTLSPERRARALYLRGSAKFSLNQTDAALADLKQSLSGAPFSDINLARLFYAQALWEKGDAASALKLFQGLLRQKEVNRSIPPELLREIGESFLKTNDFDTATACWHLLLFQKDRSFAFDGQLGLARVALARNEPATAEKILEKLKEESADTPSNRARALAYLGNALWQQKKKDQAALAFDDALKLTSTDTTAMAMARLGKAEVLFKDKKYEPALSYATSVFVLYNNPELTPKAMLLTLRILALQKRFKESKVVLKELKTRYPAILNDYRTRPENRDLFQHF